MCFKTKAQLEEANAGPEAANTELKAEDVELNARQQASAESLIDHTDRYTMGMLY